MVAVRVIRILLVEYMFFDILLPKALADDMKHEKFNPIDVKYWYSHSKNEICPTSSTHAKPTSTSDQLYENNNIRWSILNSYDYLNVEKYISNACRALNCQ